ncbi:hypothetical protein LRU84_004025 [Salmonella enterica]|nr:hypothetical protein [Salmonella enterica]EDJ4391761.1 hypothetical protein [Salmonella enterica]EGP6842226.1 hypothetical protein [Salmonella enterica]EIP7247735.1 hypothetical protein [Salmonella enterica]EJM3850822.1 hypothetical protein [Salmonella enterica]
MVLPFNGWPAVNVSEQRESGVAGWSDMGTQEKINRTMNEYAAAALDAWHTEHPFKYFLHEIFGVYEQEFMMFTSPGGQLKLFIKALLDNDELRGQLGAGEIVGLKNKVMIRFNEGTVALFTINGKQGELMCGPELGCGGKEIWDSLQEGIVNGSEGDMDLAMEIMLRAEVTTRCANSVSGSNDLVATGLLSAITFYESRLNSGALYFRQARLEQLRGLLSVYQNGPDPTVDLSRLGGIKVLDSIVSAAAGRIVEKAESGAYGEGGFGRLRGINLGVGVDETAWNTMGAPGDATIYSYDSATTIIKNMGNDIMSMKTLREGDTHPLSYDIDIVAGAPIMTPPTPYELRHGDLDLYAQRMIFKNQIEHPKLVLKAALSLQKWLSEQGVPYDNKYFLEAATCLGNLVKWCGDGCSLEGLPAVTYPQKAISADDIAADKNLNRIYIFQQAVTQAIKLKTEYARSQMGFFIQGVKSTIETGKASWELLKNATDKKTTDHTINGMVCGWDRPCEVALRATTMDGGMVIYDDGQYCFCKNSSALPLTDGQALMIIRHCNEHNLTPVLASINLFGECVNIGLSPERRAEPSLVKRIIFKDGTPPEVRLESGTVEETLARARIQGINVVAGMYPPFEAPPISTATLISMLDEREEPFHIVCALPDVDADGVENPELINLSIDFDIGDTCANCSLRVHVPSGQRQDLTNYLRSREKFTSLLLQSMLDAEQVFDSDSYSQSKTLAELCYSGSKDILIAAIAPKDESSTQITMIGAGDPINFEVSMRDSSRGEHRGKVLIDSLQKAGEDATRLSASALFSVTSAVDGDKYPNEKLNLLRTLVKEMTIVGEMRTEMLVRHKNAKKAILKLEASGAESTQDIYVNITPEKLREKLVEGISHSYRRDWLYVL